MNKKKTQTSKRAKTTYTRKKQSAQVGRANYVVIVAVLVVLALIGVGIYFFANQQPKNANKTDTSNSQQTELAGNSVTLLGGSLTLMVPDGWSKGYETSLVKDIDGTTYKVSVQGQGVDYLQLDTVGGYASDIATVKTTQGTTLYIIKIGQTKDATDVAVSSCAATGGFGCAPEFDNKKLFMTLSAYSSGQNTAQLLDYSLPSTTTAISEFEAIAASLPL